ncbi:MAG: VWA-like domain-containing protein [Eubacterium sp.]|nr:VWA-like domain-containing protein [Eubacterium sp.]
MDINDKEERKKIEELADKVMTIARDTIAMNLRFLDTALSALRTIPKYDIKEKGATVGGGMATDGEYLYYDPIWVLKTYREEPNRIARTYLHLMLHLTFFHPFEYSKMETMYWDLASDVAVEATILSMNKPFSELKNDNLLRDSVRIIRREAGGITAEKIYRYLKINGLSESAKIDWFVMYHKDEHIYFRPKKEISIILEKWQKISERVKTDIKNFSGEKDISEELDMSLKDATRERYDYAALLRRFMAMGEDMQINDDEFDYIYYTYGMETYGNMPLVEPLEYKDDKKIRDFVIAIDTSGSTKGEVVRNFLKKTYDILSGNENFFTKVNIHIIQCDSKVRSDTVIKDIGELMDYAEKVRVRGFGSTDFRPVFEYVDALRKAGELMELKGLIYFTDGYGIYPPKMPDYQVLFAFIKEDEYAPEIPVWAYKVVLPPEQFEDSDTTDDTEDAE